jgi:protein-tyrosine phosphatase
MATNLYFVEGPWPGKLAIAARPRGGDWLQSELAYWHDAGINNVVSLLTTGEEETLDLTKEAQLVRANGMSFVSFPVPDRQVPGSQAQATNLLDRLNRDLSSGSNVVIHCRQGIGRSGLVAASLLVMRGQDVKSALARLGRSRGVLVPETPEQVRWLEQYAASLAASK